MKRLLIIRMLEMNVSMDELSEFLGLSKSSLSKKLNGKIEFKKSEMLKIKNKLSLTDLDFMNIFFKMNVA